LIKGLQGSELIQMMIEKFTDAEVAVLSYQLLRTMADPLEVAEILRDFVVTQGYGVSSTTALDAATRIGASGCLFATIQEALETVALVM
jgi:hypothetical protein